MDIDLFERSIKHIKNTHQVELFESIPIWEKSFGKKEKIATIMFDDGYKDNIEYAAPILSKYGINASFYVVTNCIDNNIPTWTYIIDDFIQENSKNIILNYEFLPQELKYLELDNQKKKKLYSKKIKSFLKSTSHQNRAQIVDFFSQKINLNSKELMMSWKDLMELKNQGHYIGSHTINHTAQATMEIEEEIIKELEGSKKVILSKLGHDPITISYPVGSFSDSVKKISKKCGYKYGLVVKQDIFETKEIDFFEIPRIELYNESWWKTKMRISNSLEEIKKL